jgi:hypothetical protein
MWFLFYHEESGRIIQKGHSVEVEAQSFPGCVLKQLTEEEYNVLDMALDKVVDGKVVRSNNAEQIAADRQWQEVRRYRDLMLSECDWVVTKAAEEGLPVPENWRQYRQSLRDVTSQPDPFAILWPKKP